MEVFIHRTFNENFARLRLENRHSLSPELKRTALQQVLAYWRRLRDEVAKKVTQTEVKLNLPSQKSPKGRKFGIDGVVDIVREGNRTIMYDIKTHNPEYIQANKEEYEQQMNIYAYVWRNLREQDLDEAAIITTQFPDSLKHALDRGDKDAVARILPEWNPIIPIQFNTGRIKETINDFGKVVDSIEEYEFNSPSIQKLVRVEIKGRTFASRVCRNCDGRFSCSSYREYVKVAKGGSVGRLKKFFNDYGEEEDQNAQIDNGLDTILPPSEVLNNI
jgi:hypothetical protein